MLPSELLGMCNDTADAPSRRMRSHALYPLRMLAVVFCGDPETFLGSSLVAECRKRAGPASIDAAVELRRILTDGGIFRPCVGPVRAMAAKSCSNWEDAWVQTGVRSPFRPARTRS
jgi:hypothetical protein